METRKKKQSTGSNSFRLFKQKGSQYYYVEIMHAGRRRKFSTGKSAKREAETKARNIVADLKSRGWEETIELHSKKRESIPNDPTIEEFCDMYELAHSGFDKQLRKQTTARYIRELKRICKKTRVKRLSALKGDKIKAFKQIYLKEALQEKKDHDSARRTLNAILRNASAMFSRQALSAYRDQGVSVGNPFEDSKPVGVKLKSYTPLPEAILTKIWDQSLSLRDGYPTDQKVPDKTFHKANPEAYCLLLLELGIGLRRNEADKAEWNWIRKDNAGNFFMEIRESEYFRPKSGESRVVPIQEEIDKELNALRNGDEFIVPSKIDGNEKSLKAHKDSKHYVYRCEPYHKKLIQWLRWLGVDDPKPCHRLRKEFGSHVATTMSLFYAQKYLGHSTPEVTSRHYAGLTNLPVPSNFKPASK